MASTNEERRELRRQNYLEQRRWNLPLAQEAAGLQAVGYSVNMRFTADIEVGKYMPQQAFQAYRPAVYDFAQSIGAQIGAEQWLPAWQRLASIRQEFGD